MPTNYVYKILPNTSPYLGTPVPVPSSWVFPQTEVDARDGYVHLSTAAQLPNTLSRFFKDDESVAFLKDEKVTAKLDNVQKLSEVSVNDYDAVFYIGGHGPVIDLAVDPINIKLASQFWPAGKIVSAVCHGPAAIVGATDSNGVSIFKGREATGFSNAEEIAVDQVKVRLPPGLVLARKHGS